MYERVRRSKKAEWIVSNAETVKVFSLDNCFKGEKVEGERMPRMRSYLVGLYRDLRFSKLYRTGGKTFTLHVHGNLWYELTSFNRPV